VVAAHNSVMAIALAETLAEERRLAAQREAALKERIEELNQQLRSGVDELCVRRSTSGGVLHI